MMEKEMTTQFNPAEACALVERYSEFAKRDDCLDQMVPSDLRVIVGTLIRALAENERLREALIQIERTYYTEGKADKWRAVKMNEIAYAAQNGETDQ